MKIKSNTSLSLRKFLLSALVAAPLATLPAPLWALPQTTGGNVTSSSATTTFQTNSPANTVLSITDPVATRLVLRWVNFGSGASSIANGETVIWNLPSSSSGVLNTVTTGATLIDGALQSNGSIFIMNPNGIILGNTATVTAAGFGLSTINEPEFFFVNNGNLSYSAATPATADVVVGTATINVGTTGSVFMAGRAVDVSGTITAGTLNLTSNNATTGVRLGQAGALTLGTPGVLATLIDPAVPGTGDLVINTNGGPAVLSGAGTTSVLGGDATITTGGGAITQGAGLFSVGDNVSNSNLTLNTGTGAVTLGNLGGNGARNNVTLTTGVTSITTNAGTATSLGNTTTGRIALNAGTVTGTGAGAALTIVAGGSSIDSAGDVTVTGGTIALTTVANNAGITFKGPGDLVFSTLGTANTTGSGVTLTSTTGSVTLPAAVIGGNLTVTAQTNITQSAGVLTVIGAATNRVASFDAVTGSVTMTNATNDFTRVQIKNAPGGASIVDANSVVIANGTNATGAVTLSTLAGSITFGAGASETTRFTNNLTLNAGAATAAAATVTAGGTGYTTATVTISAPNVPGGTQATGTATIAGGVITSIAVVGGSGYSTPPTVTITGDGAGAAATLGLTTGSTINDANDNNTVIGALTVNAGGAITLNGATSNTVGLNNQFGQVNANTASALTVYEATTLNLGSVTAASLRAYGVAGLIQSGALNITGVSAFGAGTGAAPGDITLTNTSNMLAGAISFLDDFGLLNNTGPNGAGQAVPTVTGNYLARNITLQNSVATTLGVLSNTSGSGITGNLTVTATGGTNSITLSGRTDVSGAGGVTLTAPGALTATNTNSRIARYTVTAGGNVDLRSNSNVTVNATLTQAVAGATASFTSQNAITIGTFTSDYTGTVRFRVADNSRAITDSVAGIRIFGPVTFSSDGAVTINRANHSFGGVTISTGNNASATIVESGGLRLVDVGINGSGSFTATSTTGDILQDTTVGVGLGIRFTNGNSSATFNAPLGRVLLTDGGRNNLAGRINATAAGDVIIASARDVILGNITTMGKLTVDKTSASLIAGINVALATGGAGYTTAPVTISAPNLAGGTQATATATIGTGTNAGVITGITIVNPGSGYTAAPVITIGGDGAGATVTASTNLFTNTEIMQFAGSRLNVFDTVTLRTNAGGAGNITVGNTGNRMGGVVVSNGTGTITLTEESTLNLKSVSTAGSLNATSEFNSIIDSTDANIVQAATATATAIANTIVVGGTATMSAPSGSITLDLASSNYNVIGFNAAGNVLLTDNVGGTTLGTSTIGGTLDVINTVASATLGQNGSVKVQGNTTFTTNAGTIDLGNTANEFGGLRFVGNQVAITENTTLNLRAGSSATGPAVLNTNANFVTSGIGGSSFSSTLTINAPNGSITPGAGSLLVIGTFTVFSNVLKDLSLLSKSGNLLNKDPINLGTGTYVPPGP